MMSFFMRCIFLRNTTLFIMLMTCYQLQAKQVPLNSASFEKIKQANLGKQWLMVLWSVDCPACFKELALLKKLRQQQSDLALVIINADDASEVSQQRIQVMKNYKMDDLTNYYFIDGEGDRSRFMIDANWYGELPRSYFIDRHGKFHGKSGLLEETLIKTWLNIH